MTNDDVRIALVVAVADNGVIGRDGALPWRLSSDLRFFRKVTMNKPLIMGRKTFESIGSRSTAATTSSSPARTASRHPGIHVYSDVEDALQFAREKARERGTGEISVIGGAEVYALTLPVADVIYLTEVHASPEGDTFFPDYEADQWREVSRERHIAGPKDNADYSFVVLERERR